MMTLALHWKKIWAGGAATPSQVIPGNGSERCLPCISKYLEFRRLSVGAGPCARPMMETRC